MLELTALRKSLSIAETSLNHKIEQNNGVNAEIKKLNEQAEEAKKESESREMEDLSVINKKISEKPVPEEKKQDVTDDESKLKCGNLEKLKERILCRPLKTIGLCY